jgi:hypothetical protein
MSNYEMGTYKWFGTGARDPETGVTWPARPEAGLTRMRFRRGSDSHAIAVGGLPYLVSEELWEVEVEGMLGVEPFPEQTEHVRAPELLRESEQQIRASRGRLIRRIQRWTPELAEAFSRECAARARARSLQAARDVCAVLAAAAEADRGHFSEGFGEGEGPDPMSREREAAVVLHTERVLRVWRQALEKGLSRAVLPPDDAARAAAVTREIAALTYASAKVVGGPDPRGAADAETATSIAYLGARRWQSMWLAQRLGLEADVSEVPDSEPPMPDSQPPIPLEVMRDLGQLEPSERKRVLRVIRGANERVEQAESETASLRRAVAKQRHRRWPFFGR